jgi:hypothetical protein
MNKNIYTLTVLLALFLVSCSNSSVERISTSVRSITKCCNSIKKITAANPGTDADEVSTSDAEPDIKPVHSWDTKMVIW